MRSIRRGMLLALVVFAFMGASAVVSIARTPSEESTGKAASPATLAVVVPDMLAGRLSGAFTGIPDAAAMVLAGAALFGVAAAVRRVA